MNPLGVAVHLQDDQVKCGNACAQMIARFLKPAAPIHQQVDFTSASAPVPPWDSSPDQLCDMLNQFRPASVPAYVVTAAGTPQEAMAVARANVDGLAGPRCPVAALTIHGGHWEVVHGFSGLQAAPTLHVRNPLPERDLLFQGPPPPHADNDTCNTENIVAAGSTVPADEVVAWTTWIGSYFTVCTFEPPPWKGSYVVVAPKLPRKTKPPLPLVHLPLKRPRMTELPLLPSQLAAEFARAGLIKSGVLDDAAWRDSVQSVPVDAAERSVLVHRLDGQDPYYLVPLMDDKDLGTLVGVSAVDGEFLFSRLNPPRALVDTLFTLDEVARQVAPGGQYTTRLVWTPVRESFFSPYFPLVEFSDASGPRFYVRVFDRKRFDSLTTPGAGYKAE